MTDSGQPSDTPEAGAPDSSRARGSRIWPVLVLLAACVAAFAWANRPVRSAVAWQHDLEAAKRQAAAENSLVLVAFVSDDCIACRVMDRDVFSQPDAAAALDGFIPVRLDVNARPQLAAEFGVTAMPTLVVLAPDGELVTANVGAIPMRYFLLFLDQARDAAERRRP
jgi:thiol:disulfide interchange protein